MKVGELIKKLEKLDKNREIYIPNYDGDEEKYANFISEITTIKEHNERNKFETIESDWVDKKVNEEEYILWN